MGSLTKDWEAGQRGGVYIIAECGINHNGSYEEARRLIDMAKYAGANAAKFQCFVPELICRQDNPEFEMLDRCSLSHTQFAGLQGYCRKVGIDFICTAFDIPSATFLESLHMPYMKIGSGQSNQDFLDSIAFVKTPLIISLGMGGGTWLTHPSLAVMMHCVSSYPCKISDAHMRTIGGGKVNGFSDHTTGQLCALMAVARGARFIERHITMDCAQDGPDHHMSDDPEHFITYCRMIRDAESALGTAVHGVLDCELKTIAQLKART